MRPAAQLGPTTPAIGEEAATRASAAGAWAGVGTPLPWLPGLRGPSCSGTLTFSTGEAWGVEWIPLLWCAVDLRRQARRMEAETYPEKREAAPAVGKRKSPRLGESGARVHIGVVPSDLPRNC